MQIWSFNLIFCQLYCTHQVYQSPISDNGLRNSVNFFTQDSRSEMTLWLIFLDFATINFHAFKMDLLDQSNSITCFFFVDNFIFCWWAQCMCAQAVWTNYSDCKLRLFAPSTHTYVHQQHSILGQYVLTDPYVVVCLLS